MGHSGQYPDGVQGLAFIFFKALWVIKNVHLGLKTNTRMKVW